MRALILSAILVTQPVLADGVSQFLDRLCMHGFSKTTMPQAEATRFCACVRDEVIPVLNQGQRRTLAAVEEDIAQGRLPSANRIASTGVRDLVIAGQARCEAAFYPPSAPINIRAGELQLTLRCEHETNAPEAFFYHRGISFLSKAEIRAQDARMMADNLVTDFANVTTVIDGGSAKTEQWMIDISGHIVSPPNSAKFIERLRYASTLSTFIERGSNRYSGVFQLAGKIPARWSPCGGVIP